MIKKIIEFDLFELVVHILDTNEIESLSVEKMEKIYWKSTFLLRLMQ
jgi:hypothetical protein